MQTIDEALKRLNRSRFRSSFSLKKTQFDYIEKIGLEKVRSHATDFVRLRLAPQFPENDGKQTPMKGHPVFIAQHATACCCRSCLEKWYRVPKGQKLSSVQQTKIVNLIMAWIEQQIKKNNL